jgi:hypothetical protein
MGASSVAVLEVSISMKRDCRWVEVCKPPARGVMDAAWTWRELPAMSVARVGRGGCVLSDGRFAVLGGEDESEEPLWSYGLGFTV